MKRGYQLNLRHKVFIYAIFGLLFLSGLAWECLDLWGHDNTGFVDSPYPAKAWLMKAHGAAAYGALILIGTLIPLHIRKAWQARKNRLSGVVFLVVNGVLIASGYGLYYAGDEGFRNGIAGLHLWVGLLFPILMALHVWLGRTSK